MKTRLGPKQKRKYVGEKAPKERGTRLREGYGKPPAGARSLGNGQDRLRRGKLLRRETARPVKGKGGGEGTEHTLEDKNRVRNGGPLTW